MDSLLYKNRYIFNFTIYNFLFIIFMINGSLSSASQLKVSPAII